MENISEGDREISCEEAVNSIYIDFEGKGRSGEDACPMPHMLGSYRPKTQENKAIYKAYLFNCSWRPVANGSGRKAELAQFGETMQAIIHEAHERGGYLVYFSDHERAVIEKHCPDWLYKEFLQVAFNVKPPVDTMFNQTHPNNTADRPHSLTGYVNFYFPGVALPQLGATVGKVCAALDKSCAKSQRWRAWKPAEQQRARDLFEYNLSDCRVTWKLAKKLANYHDSTTPEPVAA